MKIIIMSIMLTALSFGANANVLKSSILRSQLCDEIVESLELEGIESSYEDRWGDEDVTLFPNLEKKCQELSKSFIVTKTTYNQIAKKMAKLEIDVKLEIKKEITVKGSFTVKRTLFNQDTGEVKPGQWQIKKSKVNFKYSDETFAKIANIMTFVSGTDGGGDLVKFDPTTFSIEKEIKKLNVDIATNNEDNGCIMTEADSYSLSDRQSIFDYFYLDSNSDIDDLLSFLKKKKQVLGIIYSLSDEWEESCAYHDIYIYLKSGVMLSLHYDQTT